MEITTLIYSIVLIFVFGMCNIALIILFNLKKTNKFLIVFIAILWNFGMSFYVFELFPGAENYFASKRIESWTGQEIKVKDVYVYEEVDGLNGDGYSLFCYDLKDNQKIDTVRLKKHSIQDGNWDTLKWGKAPINPSDSIFMESAIFLNLNNNKDSLRLKKIYDILRSDSSKNSSYYSFLKKKNRSGILLMYLSVTNKKFVLINSSS
ncbi:hypothetical protein ACSVH2_08090 [Flavobacterium sp. RSB2_4_14]|uniref:hypothetical protein n=1 Tax=Flavobacterium sp. RSB2_4_14 TaxID=3447665 RepID=UPI003F2ADB1E